MTFILEKKAARRFREARDAFRASTDDAVRAKVATDCLVMLRTVDPNMSIHDVLSIFEPDECPNCGLIHGHRYPCTDD